MQYRQIKTQAHTIHFNHLVRLKRQPVPIINGKFILKLTPNWIK